ncbi:MAG: winged helix-turn-helix transcriptional regulator [Desulfovibrio sp.]|uniref:winged helix-turn-helix transcriptional regulator n=1 Tax=Desulfovibrio sp. 7SRBS1 TaxID=3378064 RepID=UPI003B40E3AD
MSATPYNFFKPGKDTRVLSLLEGIHTSGRTSQNELGTKADLSGAMVNKYIKDLQAGGLVNPIPINGKCFEYQLTAKGETARNQMMGQYCAEIVRIYSSLKQSLLSKFEDLHKNGATTLALFGASETCEIVYNALKDTNFRIATVVDNDPQKQGEPFFGHIIASPEVLAHIRCDAVIITSFGKQEEIYEHCLKFQAQQTFNIIRL